MTLEPSPDVCSPYAALGNPLTLTVFVGLLSFPFPAFQAGGRLCAATALGLN